MFFSGYLARGRALAFGVVCMAAVMASGCAEMAKEALRDDALLLNKGNNFFARSRFNQSTASYRKLVETFPDSSYKKAALIGLADSLFKEGQFEEANLHYERFVELYPLDDLTPRALFYFGMCHMMLTSSPDRNQTKVKMSIDYFGEFIARYPDNQLAPQAAWYKKEMERMRAQSKMEIARFYHRVGKNISAIGRLREFIEENPSSQDAPEAMFLLGESFMREQSYKNAAEAFTILIGAYPKSEWAQKARASAVKLTIKAN